MTKAHGPARVRPPNQRAAGRYEWWGFGLAGITAVVTAGTQVSGKFDQAPTWVPVSLYLLAGVIAVAAALAKKAADDTTKNVQWGPSRSGSCWR